MRGGLGLLDLNFTGGLGAHREMKWGGSELPNFKKQEEQIALCAL
jgi:hypothetical protein